MTPCFNSLQKAFTRSFSSLFDSDKLSIFDALFSFLDVNNSGKTLSEGLMSHCDSFI